MEARVNGVKRIMLETSYLVLSEMFGQCNTIMEDSAKCREYWRIKDWSEK